MPGSATAEIYFIAAMMILILIVCAVAVFVFARTYRKEMRERSISDKAKGRKEASAVTNKDGVPEDIT